MTVWIDPAAAQAFMATPLKVERNGMPLTMGSALVTLDVDPWSLAGELAIAPRNRAVTRLESLLGMIEGGVPEAGTIASQAVDALPLPSVEGADLVTIVRLASRNPELTGALVCSLALTVLAMLMVVFVIFGGLLPVLAGYCLVGLIWTDLSRRHGNVLPSLFSVASGMIGAIFTLVHFGT